MWNWIFIIIGLIGAFLTISLSTYNFLKFKQTNNLPFSIFIQWINIFINIAMFTYAFGLSMVNVNTQVFYNSMPTWIGNGIALIINLNLTITIILKKRA